MTIASVRPILACLLALTFPLLANGASPMKADVVVYGATPSGFCAAIAAAREGASVILLEPTKHVGGVNTGGLSFSDSNQTVRQTVRGLFEEWHERIERDYQQRGVTLPYKVSEKDHTHWTYEPHVAARVTRQMLDEAGVKVFTERRLLRVDKSGPRIQRLVTPGGEFEASVFIDTTYEGDLMAAAGVSWTLGREGRDAFDEPLAGKQFPKTRMAINGLGSEGKPLPLTTTTDAGPEADGDRNVMVYSFRLCLTREASNRVDFPAPEHYDPARFEVLRRYFAWEKSPVVLWDLYPLPGGKFDANNGIGKQFSMGLVGGGNAWCGASPEDRAKIWEAHKQYTLELHHFLTTDPAVPANLREQLGSLGLCRDEFGETGHWSPQLYVREGRRMKGAYTLTQRDIMDSPKKDDAIAVSSFPIDSHDCQRVATAENVINEGTIFPVRMAGRKHGYPYHVPYRAITPRSSECENLLVPVALSASHVAYCSIRVEPTWMLLGQSAGVAAALAVKEKIAVQHLAYDKLRSRLLAQKQVLELPALPPLPAQAPAKVSIDPASLPGIVLDDAQAKLKGTWSRSATFKPHIGTGYLHDDRKADGQSSATWRFKVPESGNYELRMAYSPHETRTTKVPLVIQNGQRNSQLTVDQTLPLPLGQSFRSLGKVQLSAEVETVISLSNTGTDGFVILDALQLLPEPKPHDPRETEAAVERAHREIWKRFVDEHNVILDYTDLDGRIIRPTPEDCHEMKPSALSWGVPVEDGPMFNGLYLDALCQRWKRTQADEDRVKARRLVDGLLFLASVGQTPGFIARGVATDGKTTYPMGSNDQTTPWLVGIWRYLREDVATAEERPRLIARFAEIVAALDKSGWRMPCEGGPSPYRGDFTKPTWEGAPRLLFVMKAMHDLTGDARWRDRYLAAANERVGKGQRTRLEICRTGMVFDPGQGARHSWTGSEGVVCLRALWEMETDSDMRGAYAAGLRASAELSAKSLPLCVNFNFNGTEHFESNWRLMNEAWKPQHSEAETVEVANAGLRVQHRVSPRLHLEKDWVREPCFAAWVVTLCPDREFVEQHREAIAAVIQHYRYDRIYLSQFFPVESAWYRLGPGPGQ